VLTLIYIALSVLGCGYIVVSAFLGHLFESAADGGGHADAGHAPEVSDYGIGDTGHGAVTAMAPVPAAFHFPFFSPLALATLFAAIGGFGLIARWGIGTSDPVSLAVALPAALLTAYAVTYLAWRLVTGSRGSSQIRLADLKGLSAEVITPIPARGVGEIVALVHGQRYTAAARAENDTPIARGVLVTIREFAGATVIVVPPRGTSDEGSH
jgi:membrane protein implicated in regulation of membrane protease activity